MHASYISTYVRTSYFQFYFLAPAHLEESTAHYCGWVHTHTSEKGQNSTALLQTQLISPRGLSVPMFRHGDKYCFPSVYHVMTLHSCVLHCAVLCTEGEKKKSFPQLHSAHLLPRTLGRPLWWARPSFHTISFLFSSISWPISI